MLLGIDEAGRGPVIGPLVICGVWVKPEDLSLLCALGVQDSKAFGSTSRARQRRQALAEQIRQIASHTLLLTAEAEEIDARVKHGELNRLEQELAQKIITQGPVCTHIIADGKRLFAPLTHLFSQLEALDRADATQPVVAAASIVAKVERDRRFENIIAPLRTKLGQIRGGGYVNRATADFLKAHAEHFGCLPEEVRHSWSWPTLREIEAQLKKKSRNTGGALLEN